MPSRLGFLPTTIVTLTRCSTPRRQWWISRCERRALYINILFTSKPQRAETERWDDRTRAALLHMCACADNVKKCSVESCVSDARRPRRTERFLRVAMLISSWAHIAQTCIAHCHLCQLASWFMPLWTSYSIALCILVPIGLKDLLFQIIFIIIPRQRWFYKIILKIRIFTKNSQKTITSN